MYHASILSTDQSLVFAIFECFPFRSLSRKPALLLNIFDLDYAAIYSVQDSVLPHRPARHPFCVSLVHATIPMEDIESVHVSQLRKEESAVKTA